MLSMTVLLMGSLACCVAANRPRSSYQPPRPSPSYSRPAPASPQSSQQGYSPSSSQQQAPAKYEFDYAVNDEYSGNDYGHQESRDGSDTQGSYYVQLPDGRLQTVNYYVSGDSGFVAEVSYEGEAQYPAHNQGGGDYQAPQQSYQQPQQSRQQPQQSYQQPQQSRQQPQQSYQQPQQSYQQPRQQTYQPPTPSYG